MALQGSHSVWSSAQRMWSRHSSGSKLQGAEGRSALPLCCGMLSQQAEIATYFTHRDTHSINSAIG